MTFPEPDLNPTTGLLSDPYLLKESVVACFTTIFGPDFTSINKLGDYPPYKFFYSFPGGQIEFYQGRSGDNTLYGALLHLYSTAESSVMLETKLALKEKSLDYNSYMTACLYLTFIDREIIYSRHKNGETPNPDMWWVERMFLDDVPVDTIMLAATLGTDELTEHGYESFLSNVKEIPGEWLHEMYPAEINEGTARL